MRKSLFRPIHVIAFLTLLLFEVACDYGYSGKHEIPAQSNSADTCNDPDGDISCCFISMPEHVTNTAMLAPSDEEGEKLIIQGKVLGEKLTALSDVLLYFWHTDATGHYSKSGKEKGIQKWHGRLHGWCRTDAEGNYEIRSIRPAPYPDNTMPAHIHCALMLPGQGPIYINDFVFADDPLINASYKNSEGSPGGSGIVQLSKNNDESWHGKRNIVLSNE